MRELPAAQASAMNMNAAAICAMGAAVVVVGVAGTMGVMPHRATLNFIGQAVLFMLVAVGAGKIVWYDAPLRAAWVRLVVGVTILAWAAVYVSVAYQKAKVQDYALAALRTNTPALASHATEAVPVLDPIESGATGAEKMVFFMKASGAIETTFLAESGAIAARMDALDLKNALTPASLTDPRKLASSRLVVTQFMAMIKERRAAFDRYGADAERHIRTGEMPERARMAALGAFMNAREPVVNAFTDVERLQSKVMAIVERILDFADARRGATEATNGQLMLSTPADLERYRALVAELEAAVEQEKKALVVIAKLEKARLRRSATLYKSA